MVVLEGALMIVQGVRRKQGFRPEGEARREGGWPALAQCMVELVRVALWMAPRVKVGIERLLGRCVLLAEKVFAAVED